MAKRRLLMVHQHIGTRDCCACRLRRAKKCLAFDAVLVVRWNRFGFGYLRCQPCLDAEKAGRDGD